MLIYTPTTYKPRRRSKKQKELEAANKRGRFKKEFSELKTLPPRPVSSADKWKSVDLSKVDISTTVPVKYEGDLAAREAAAQVEIERKKKMTAPLANKMGYQYIGDMPESVIKTLGRKV